jgi:3-hydroxy-9,10-secoandrosta-1,3,5(10)-triene-9,17-dione monooxygenase
MISTPVKLVGCHPEIVATTHTNLVAAATALIPALRSRSSETDALARLPDSTIADLEKAHLFDMLVPKIYGGLQCSPRTFMDVVVELGRGDGSAAWALAIVSAGTWMAATLYPKHVVDEIFSGENFRTASVLAPHKVKAKRVDGGVLIEEGSWSFNSGVYHAQWDILNIPIFDESGQFIDRGTALIPISQVRLLHDWDTIGVRGSGSTSVAVKDAFVPNERIALLSKTRQEDYASTHLRDVPLYRLALVPFFATNLVFPALGIAKAALELFLEKAPHRGIPYTWYEKQDEAAITHLQAGEASAKIDAAELMLRRSVDVLEASAASGTRMALEQRARIRRDAGAASQLIWEAMDLLAGASGGSFAYTKNPMNRLWRDGRVAGMHGGINASTNMELFGRILCQKEPNSPML